MLKNSLKIYITGGPGSGKTTLAEEIASRFAIPFIEFDDIYKKNGLRHAGWIEAAFAIASRPTWVTEDGGLIWNDPILASADYIVLLEVPWRTAAYRIVRRHIIKTLRSNNPHPGVMSLIHFWLDSRQFYLNQYSADIAQSMNRCLEEQKTITEELDAEQLLARIEQYELEVIRVPTINFLRQYLEKYKQKLIVVKNNAERARLLDFLAQQR